MWNLIWADMKIQMQNKWFNNIKGNYINIQNKNIQLICKSFISWLFLKFYSKKYFQKNILNEILFCFIQDKKQIVIYIKQLTLS